jgi:CheY-like chemotaxis protein
MIVGDAVRLRQVVFNLMSNALKFTATGGVSLSVSIVAGDRLHIVVADTGIGIAADKCDDIFESFRQADTSTTRQFGGTGLGLSICRNILRAMGGDVIVASSPGTGSRFTVDLPLTLAPAVPAEGVCTARTPCLLIVDRSPITRAMLKTLLTPHAPTIALAASLGDAVSILRDGGVERMLVDAAVLTASGDAVAAARQLADAGDRVRIVVLWPAGSDPNRDDIVTIEGLSNVIKPVSGPSLVASLHFDPDAALVSQAA